MHNDSLSKDKTILTFASHLAFSPHLYPKFSRILFSLRINLALNILRNLHEVEANQFQGTMQFSHVVLSSVLYVYAAHRPQDLNREQMTV